MGLFQHNEEEKRSLEDILTPKCDDEEEENLVAEDDEDGEEDAPNEESVNEAESAKDVGIKVETPEEVSFNALTCFGWSETKTPKWLIKCAKVWFLMMSLLYFVFGALTFAPIIFIQHKVNSVVRDKKMSFIIAVVIYAVAVVLFTILIGARCGAQDVANAVNKA